MHPGYLFLSVMLSLLSATMVFHAAGRLSTIVVHAILISFLPAGGSLFLSFSGLCRDSSRKALFIHCHLLCMCLLACSLLCVSVNRSLDADFCFERQYIRVLEGRVVYDSSFTESGNHFMRIQLTSCALSGGDTGQASGVVPVVGKEKAVLSAGLDVRLEGSFEGEIFICDSLSVTRRSILNDWRERIIGLLERRLLGEEYDRSVLLSIRLLLGRADSGRTDIQEKAAECGCAHVLALSGMHLGIIASLGTLVSGRRRHVAQVLSSLLVAAFVFIAGPRASLVRAALFFMLSRIPAERRTAIVFVIQCVLFPFTMVEAGCCYGYLAVFAIVHLSPYLDGILHQYVGRLSKLVSASLAVLMFSVPFQMVMNGFWCPAVIIASPVSGLLAGLSMVMGLLLLAFGHLAPVVWADRVVYTAMDRLFDLMLGLPHARWGGYAILLAVPVLLFVLNRIIAGHVIKKKRAS